MKYVSKLRRQEADGRWSAVGSSDISASAATRYLWIIAAITLAALTLGSAVRTVHLIRKAQQSHSTLEINDFDRWMQRLPAHLERHADLVDERSANTVLDMFLLAPFTHLSRAAAQVAWTFCKPPIIVAILACMLAMTKRAGITLTPLSVALVLAAWLWPTLGDIQEGQTNLLMLLPLVAGLALAQRQTPKNAWLGGLLIALAIAIKVTPLVFLPYALLRRQWHLAAAILVGILVWFLLVPALAFGWAQNLLWQAQWTHIMILPFARGDVPVLAGESLPSFLTKLLRDVPAFTSFKTGHQVNHYLNVANLSPHNVAWIIRLTIASIAAAGVWWMRQALKSLQSPRFVCEIGCVAAFMLWASQWTLVAHYVTLLLPLFAVAMILSNPASSPIARRTAAAALTAAALLMALTSDLAKAIAGPDGREYMLMLNVCLVASVSLVAAIVTAACSRAPVLPLHSVEPRDQGVLNLENV